MIRPLVLLMLAAALPAEIVELPPSTFCSDQPIFCFGKPGECLGLVNNKGQIIKRFFAPFKIMGPYREGLLAVVDPKSGLTGYLDTEGEWALKPQWEVAHPFSSGRARFCEDGKCGFIDKQGKVAIEPRFNARGQRVTDFDAEGYARFYTADFFVDGSRRAGLIDRSGEIVIKPTLFKIGEYFEGVAPAVLKGPCWFKGGFVGDMGPVVELLGHSSVGLEYESPERLGVPRCIWRLVDSSGSPVTRNEFLYKLRFSDGMVVARTGQDWGYVGSSGDFLISARNEAGGYRFSMPQPFSEGLAAVHQIDQNWSLISGEPLPSSKGGWAYVDKSGRVAHSLGEDLRTRQPGQFKSGLARVSIPSDDYPGYRTRFINILGEFAFEASIKRVTDFCHGVAQVSREIEDGLYEETLINTQGKEIFRWTWR